MIALSFAMSLGFGLAYLAWRDWLALHKPLPPHEDAVKRITVLEERMHTLEAWADIRHGKDAGFGD